MTDVICLQCWAMLHQIRAAHRDHELYHPAPSSTPPAAKAPRARYPYQLEPSDQPAITYPDSDTQ